MTPDTVHTLDRHYAADARFKDPFNDVVGLPKIQRIFHHMFVALHEPLARLLDRELAGEYGRLALDLDQVGAANQLLAVADDPTKPDWRVISARGTVMAKQGKYSDAIPFYERALTLSQNNPTVLNNLAMAYAMMGDAKKAEEILRQAVTTEGAAPKVRENLALVLGLQGRYDESRSVAAGVLNSEVASANTSYLKQMVKLDPTSAMPDARSFATKTEVARAAPVEQPTESKMAASSVAEPATGSVIPGQ